MREESSAGMKERRSSLVRITDWLSGKSKKSSTGALPISEPTGFQHRSHVRSLAENQVPSYDGSSCSGQ
jgi:hypothetical protein